MPIASPIGYLDVVNATLRASQVEAVSRLSVANTATTQSFSVGERFHVNKDSIDPVSITGNVVASGVKIGNLSISPTFDFASVSNVGNVTANVIQFANATTGFTTTANVEIGGNITLTANAQVKVGSNVLAEYTGPHGREPKEVPIKKYPEIAFDASKLDGNDTTNTYVQAGYTVTASSSQYANLGFYPWKVFDGNITATNTYHGWHSGGNPSTVSGSPYNTIDSSYVGEWIKLELPKAIKLNHFTIAPRDGYAFRQAPKDFKVYGSNDDSTWVELVEVTNATVYIDKQFNTTNVTTSDYYKYFALVIQDRVISGGAVAISGWELYGYEEPAPVGDLSLDTTLKSTFNSVRSNNYVMYFDGEGFDPNDTNSNNLVTGSSVSVVHHNATYDSTGKYWTLDGSTESNVTTGSLGLVGDVPHTVSTWINASNLEANASTQQLFSIGSGYSEEIVRVDDTQIAANTWHNVTYAYQGEGGSKVTYVDGRKVEEAQVEDTFGDYPPFAMTDYEVGGYRVSVSSAYIESTYRPFSAFNDGGTDINNVWHSTPSYTGTSSEYVGDVRLAANVDPGHWIKLETPHKLQVSYVNLVARPPSGATNLETQAPKDFQVCGSNDDVNWDVLASFTGEAPQDDGTSNYNVNAQRGYKYLALAVNKAVNSTSVTIANIKFYGHKEGDLTRFPEPTRVLKYPHIAMTGPGQRGYVVQTSGNNATSNDGWKAFNGVGFNGQTNAGDHWITPDLYTHDTGAFEHASTAIYQPLGTGATGAGAWIAIKSPHKIKLTKLRVDNVSKAGFRDYTIHGRNGGGTIVGGTSWSPALLTVVDEGSGYSQSGNYVFTETSHNITTNDYYEEFIIIITKKTPASGTGDNFLLMRELELYGTEEDTGTPAIVGGPFAGKVANFRVYDQYLGDERIQEIYDAQKDEFGHKKSSMTLYKGRVGVGTTEPEGALTVVDEPHALAKFPARAVSADDSYVEGDGQIKLSAADGSGYQAFDGLTSTSWTATPTRNTRLSEEVDFGAWLKIQTPESVSLKKAEIESNPYWRQVGGDLYGDATADQLGRSNDCSHDGTRIILSSYAYNSSQGRVRVYDWNGTTWTQVGSTVSLTGTATGDRFGRRVAISGDGNIIAIAAPHEHVNSLADAGTVRVYYLTGSTWTILPDSGSLTETETGFVDAFVGTSTSELLGEGGVILSYDGKTLAIGERVNDTGGSNRGRARVFTYSDGAWSQKGVDLVGTVDEQQFGYGIDMSEDGNHLIVGTGTSTSPVVQVYKWNVTDTRWDTKGSAITYSGDDGFGRPLSISNDGNVIALGIPQADVADGALADDNGLVRVYHYVDSDWDLNSTLLNEDTGTDSFGAFVQLSGDGKRMVVSAPNDNSNRGKLYTFEYNGTSWTKRESGATGANVDDYLGHGAITSDQGVTLSRDGSTIVGSELGHDTSGFSNNGRVRVWNMPSNIKSIWGSNDDVNWTKITTGNETFRVTDRLEFKNLDNPNYYKYHAIVADAFTRLKDIKLYGIRNQGSSTLHDGTLTLTKKVTAPQLESTGIINMKGDYTEIRANSNVVTEFNRSKKLIKYPRVALTSAAQTGSGYEGHFVSQNTGSKNGVSNRQAWALFDNILRDKSGHAGPHFLDSIGGYDSNGDYTRGDSLGGVSGDWAYIRLPDKIQLQSVDLWARYSNLRNPIDATVLGSLNGTNWNVLGSWKNAKFTVGKSTSFTINSIQYYDYIGFVFEKIEANSSGTYVNFHEIELYGTPEYDPDAHGTDVVVKSVPNVPNTDWLEVYYDAKNYSGSGDVQDESGNDRDGTLYGDTSLNSADGIHKFDFDGSGDYIVRTGIPTPTGAGNFTHTVSMWFKLDSLAAAVLLWGLAGEPDGTDGTLSGSDLPHAAIGTNGLISWAFWGNDVSNQTAVDINRWYHCVWTYSGGTNGRGMFLDGVEQVLGAQTIALNMPNSTSRLAIGIYPHNLASNPFTGSIANFRLFNRALTSDEIWQLYAYQKEYFGHGDLGMTLKNGRLGIGTSEPRAALDVRGDAFFSGLVSSGMPAIFGAVNNQNLVRQTSITQNISVVQFSQGPNMKRAAGGITFPIAGMYQVQLCTHCWYSGGGVAVKSTHILDRYNSAGTIYSKANRGSIVNQTLGTTEGNSDQQQVTTWLIHGNAGDYVILNHNTSPETTRNYNNEWNYISAACVCLDELQFSS